MKQFRHCLTFHQISNHRQKNRGGLSSKRSYPYLFSHLVQIFDLKPTRLCHRFCCCRWNTTSQFPHQTSKNQQLAYIKHRISGKLHHHPHLYLPEKCYCAGRLKL
ncbi:uncharacterized protein LOC124371982 [Homalodisca vitripennis]|uniref:uncharacterized protein LOC124357615 n=1 Tax=Homalodisca vitripennis TaxID=197043 RepID=UPI001EEB0BD0|nr:uncharacterized protein LOC124357615 [Homalodisca vitripennis]XP_046684491.1 uncharacterized protein LOC124370246 [Homalodisca vitripennis]XP_046684537.1 uncharacterized protein LOC124370292 [Homalodisca vitripennis]XP_046684783.1 uncharacterized protein LOC124370538 [Homalodisca vitripennis]XP_046686306.1 uncharacterized protein LOC124371982 [Homalodisca vitripennis]